MMKGEMLHSDFEEEEKNVLSILLRKKLERRNKRARAVETGIWNETVAPVPPTSIPVPGQALIIPPPHCCRLINGCINQDNFANKASCVAQHVRLQLCLY